MTPEQLVEKTVNDICNLIIYTGDPAASRLKASLLLMITPVCGEKDCETTEGLVRCWACGGLMCGRHSMYGTGTEDATGEPQHLCFDCAPGPEPTEY